MFAAWNVLVRWGHPYLRATMETVQTRQTNRYLLIEVGLIIALLVVSIFLYWRPAAEGDLTQPWWHWPSLALLFFSVVGLHTWRRKRGL